MDEVATGLFVGTTEDAGNASLLEKHDITAIVSLTHTDPDGGFPSDIIVLHAPMVDGPQNEQQIFTQAVTDVLSQLDTGENVLVHCSAGASRSPAVAATALAVGRDLTLEEAFQQVSERRLPVDPHTALVRQAVRVYTDIVGKD